MKEMKKVLEIMEILRGENGCNWDKKQTHESLLPYVIEETYEVVDALEKKDFDSLKEELGDLLFQIVFHSQLAKEAGKFEFIDILESLSQKLISRHPHVFGNPENLTSEEVLENWDKLKAKENLIKGVQLESILDGIPRSLPALAKAEKLQQKAAKVGFDWQRPEEIVEKIEEELEELKQELNNSKKNFQRVEEELGDLLFAVVNLSRFLKLSSELALRKANEKFELRFKKMEQEARQKGLQLHTLSLWEMEELWNKAKEEN